MRMRPAEGGLTLAPGETIALEPGGCHAMFADLAEPLAEGDRRPVALGFERAGDIEVEFVVPKRPDGAVTGAGHSHGPEEDR